MATTKVIVACKVPVAWLDLEVTVLREKLENTQAGPRTIKEATRTGRTIRVRGTAYPRGTPPVGFIGRPDVVNGYALTQGVDKDVWEEWLKTNAKSPMVMNGLILAGDDLGVVRGKTKEHIGELTGLEPVNPLSDPRMPKPTLKGVDPVSTEESRRASLPPTEVAA